METKNKRLTYLISAVYTTSSVC